MTLLSKFFVASLVAMSCVFTSSGAFAQEKVMRLAWTPSADVPHIPVAVNNGLWKNKGLSVEPNTFPSGRESLEALLGGQVDVAVIAEFPAATAALRGLKIGVVADVARYKANRLVTTAATPTLASLAGRKLGTTVGTNAQYQLESAMASAGITGTIVNASPADLLPTLVRKDIDAAAMFPAFFARAKQTLGEQYREIPTPSYTTHFLVVASESAMAQPAALSSLIAGFVSAEQLMAKDIQSAQAAVAKATGGMMSNEAIAASWSDYDYRVSLDDALTAQLTAEAAWILGKGLTKSALTPADAVRNVIRSEFLKSAVVAR